MAVVCDHFGDDPSHWQAGRRLDGVSRAVVAYLARRHFGYTTSEVFATSNYLLTNLLMDGRLRPRLVAGPYPQASL